MAERVPAKRKWAGCTEEQKAKRVQRRNEQKGNLNAKRAGPRITKTKRFFEKNADWNLENLGLSAGVKEIEFQQGFIVGDVHLDIIANASEAFRVKLENIGLGASLGFKEMSISDDAVVRLARACPNLERIRLDSSILITGSCVIPVLTMCPEITFLSITGNKRRLGSLNPAYLAPLTTDPVISTSAPKLKTLDLRRSINATHENARNMLQVMTRPQVARKTFKNGKEKVRRVTGQMLFDAMLQQAKNEIEYGACDDDDAYSETRSELSALIHRGI